MMTQYASLITSRRSSSGTESLSFPSVDKTPSSEFDATLIILASSAAPLSLRELFLLRSRGTWKPEGWNVMASHDNCSAAHEIFLARIMSSYPGPSWKYFSTFFNCLYVNGRLFLTTRTIYSAEQSNPLWCPSLDK